MTTPCSGSISLGNIKSEFGGVDPAGLGEYYSGAGLVHASSGIPSSGILKFSDFFCKQKVFALTITISANTYNFVASTAASAYGYPGGIPINLTIVVAGGVVVGSVNTSSYAMTIDNAFPAGSTVTIQNNGYIVGAGGAGGGGGGQGYGTPESGYAGGNGGPALICHRATTVINYGIIGGGGGGGGGGNGEEDWDVAQNGKDDQGGGGGGGAGFPAGPGGGGPNDYGASGAYGGLTTGGAGASGYYNNSESRSTSFAGRTYTMQPGYGGSGGNGGSLGQAGAGGGQAYGIGYSYILDTNGDVLDRQPIIGDTTIVYSTIGSGSVPGGGGWPGAAIVGNGNITWLPVGTIYGTIS